MLSLFVAVVSEEYKKPCNITGDNGKMAMTATTAAAAAVDAAAAPTTSIVKLKRAPKYKIVSIAQDTAGARTALSGGTKANTNAQHSLVSTLWGKVA